MPCSVAPCAIQEYKELMREVERQPYGHRDFELERMIARATMIADLAKQFLADPEGLCGYFQGPTKSKYSLTNRADSAKGNDGTDAPEPSTNEVSGMSGMGGMGQDPTSAESVGEYES